MATFTSRVLYNCQLRDTDPTTHYSKTLTAVAVGDDESSAQVNRNLLKWTNLSDIPSGATVTGAVMTLTYAADYSANARTLRVFRVKRTVDYDQVTWNKYDASNNWGTAGCGDTTNDREGTDIGNVSIPASPTIDTTVDITLTASAIQEMIAGTFTNNGFLLKKDTENNDQVDFYGVGYVTEGSRPLLTITYTVPTGGSLFFNQL